MVQSEALTKVSADTCNRHTGNIITQQLGRPVDSEHYRPASLQEGAAALGWSPAYMAGPEELETERLFDYGSLAPLITGDLQAADRTLPSCNA
jgi:hypothetical protein